MKTAIKIALIAVVAIGIIAAIVYFAKGTGDGGDVQIAETDFEKEIQEQVKSDVKGKDYDDAHAAFATIMEKINTEASITLADGSKSLKDSEVEKCRQMVFAAYAPIFTEYALDHFTLSSWSEPTMKQLKDEATALLGMGVAESGTKVDDDLKSVTRTIDEYYAAKSVIAQAERCSSVSAITGLKNKARSYNHAPLTNNSSLSAALVSVESTAKRAVESSIVATCSRVASGYANYADYATFYNAYENASNRIKEYTSAFGYTSRLRSAQSELDNVDYRALQYYADNE